MSFEKKPGVNYINILQAEKKMTDGLTVFVALLRPAGVKSCT